MRKRYKCEKCGRAGFASSRGLSQHITKAHPYVPLPAPPAPKREVEIAPEESLNQTLLRGRNLQLGDVVWLGRKSVITKITKTDGSQDVEVVLRLTKKWWSRDEIS